MSDFGGNGLSLHNVSEHRSVDKITEAAQEYEYNGQLPLRLWLRTASALLKEAEIYKKEGDLETTYLLLWRHAHLVLNHLEKRSDSKEKSVKPLLQQALREVDRNLQYLKEVKPGITQKYEEYQKSIKERDVRRATQSRRSQDLSYGDNTRPSKRRLQQLDGHENRDLAVRLAQQEFQRRADAREKPTQLRLRAGEEGDDLSRRLQAIRARVDPGIEKGDESLERARRRENKESATYNYPSVRAQQARPIPEYSVHPEVRQPSTLDQPLLPPSLPPKPVDIGSSSIPARPEKIKDTSERVSALAQSAAETTYTFTPNAFLENGNPLRTLFLPPTLRTTFLRIAHQNTKANLETCGFLAGTIISNALFVSKLIIPAQVATSDTCEMTNESQLFDYVDSGSDLMILGWIHTHPTQTCFMSSRDLHTHAGYQMMLPESIAVVCAPSKGDTAYGGDWGVFRLTDPPGKMTILNCTKPGVFHPHDVDNIYTDALRPGHVVEAQGLDFEVVDLRNA